MITLYLNDRYIRGKAIFNKTGDYTATLSYFPNEGLLPLRINAQYVIDGEKWRVTGVSNSDYNSVVKNVDLELISG